MKRKVVKRKVSSEASQGKTWERERSVDKVFKLPFHPLVINLSMIDQLHVGDKIIFP